MDKSPKVSVCQVSHSLIGDNRSSYLMGLLQVLKSLGECLAHRKCYMCVSYYYYIIENYLAFLIPRIMSPTFYSTHVLDTFCASQESRS